MFGHPLCFGFHALDLAFACVQHTVMQGTAMTHLFIRTLRCRLEYEYCTSGQTAHETRRVHTVKFVVLT